MRKRYQLRAFLTLLVAITGLFALAQRSFADPPAMQLLHPNPKEAIPGLTWGPKPLRVEGEDKVILEGRFQSMDRSLLWEKKRVEVAEGGTFQIEIPLSQARDPFKIFELIAINPFGVVQREQVKIYVPSKKVVAQKPPLKRFYLTPGATLSSISYSDNWISGYSEIAITMKGSARYLLSNQWTCAVSGYFTLASLSKSSDETARFLGLNLMMGYVIPQIRPPWRVTLLGGGYFTTMFVSGNQFGFSNMMGPLLFPTVIRAFSKGNFASGYLKYSPVGAGIGFLSLGNRELAIGGGYSFANRGHPLGITLDVASLQASVETFQFTSTSISLGMSYGF